MNKTEKLHVMYKKDPLYVRKNRKLVSAELDLDYSAVCKAIRRWDRGAKPPKRPPSKERSVGTLDEFKNEFDLSVIVPRKIDEGIERYLRRPDGEPMYMFDWRFRELCKVPVTQWRRYADNYKYLQVKNKNGELHPDIIEEMKEVLLR
jgi:hypothetical protein